MYLTFRMQNWRRGYLIYAKREKISSKFDSLIDNHSVVCMIIFLAAIQ